MPESAPVKMVTPPCEPEGGGVDLRGIVAADPVCRRAIVPTVRVLSFRGPEAALRPFLSHPPVSLMPPVASEIRALTAYAFRAPAKFTEFCRNGGRPLSGLIGGEPSAGSMTATFQTIYPGSLEVLATLSEMGEAQQETVRRGGKPVLADGEAAVAGKTGYYLKPALYRTEPGIDCSPAEVFHTYATVCPVSSTEEALRLANSSPYGLGASVWTKDIERGVALAEQFRDGTCQVNCQNSIAYGLP